MDKWGLCYHNSIEGNFAQLQVAQQKIQGSSSTTVTNQRVEEVQQVAAQCAAEVAVIQTELGGLHAKISAPIEWLKGDSWCLCWGPVGCMIPQGQFWG